MLPGITPALLGGAVLPAGNDSFTKLLLHLEGVAAGTIFTDSSPAAHGNAITGGSAQTTFNAAKFGSTSLLLDGGSGTISYPHSTDWEFGAGNFTVDWWERRSAATDQCSAVSRSPTASYQAFMLGYTSAGAPKAYMSSNGSAWDIANGQSMGGVVELNVWHHFAVVRNGNTFYTFRDGVQQATWTTSLALWPMTDFLSIGRTFGTFYFPGYIDELRVSKGVARWTANFAPPTKAYGPDPAPITNGNDYNTRILLHFDGTNGASVFPDSALGASSPHTTGGGAITSTGAVKFGVTSLYCNGASAMSTPDHVDFRLGAADWTVDAWFYLPVNTGTRRFIWGHCDSSAAATAISTICEIEAGQTMRATACVGGTSLAIVAPAASVAINAWHHVAFVRIGNILRLFVDGTQQGGDLAISGAVNPGSGIFAVGALGNYPSGLNFNGYIDELRLTVNKARWTANFTPPPFAYGAPPQPATHFSVTAPTPQGSGTAFNVTVQALDAANNPTSNYSGTVHITSTNGTAVLPADSTLISGSKQFSVTLKTGTWTVTATDTVTGSINGTSGNIVVNPPAPQTVAITSGSTWQVPASWNNANNSIEVIGGGSGAGGGSSLGGGGGAGGAYAKIANVALTPGNNCALAIGGGGNGGAAGLVGGVGGNTWLRIDGAGGQPGSTAQGVMAQGGQNQPLSPKNSAQGGQAAASIGTTKFNGGDSGAGDGTGVSGGGGGAAGPNGAGVRGTDAILNGGPGGAGDAGAGGAGGATNGSAGGNGAEWGSWGSGGGGGGGSNSSNPNGGPAGQFGAGGGGGYAGTGGMGGLIIIKWTPA